MKTNNLTNVSRLTLFVVLMAAVIGFVKNVHGTETVLYTEDFQSGTLESLEPTENTGKGLGTLIPDPDLADDSQKVLSTPDGSTQTYFWHTEQAPTTGSALELTFRFNEDQSNHEWNTSWALMGNKLLNGASIENGYGIRFGYDQEAGKPVFWIKLNRCDAGDGAGKETELTKAQLPTETVQPGWNTVKFRWSADGKLTGWLNDAEVISAQDTTHEPTFRVLKVANWVSNNLPAPPSMAEGRKIFFDDIKVVQPE